MLAGVLYDLRDAARSIVRDRAFSITAALLLAIGIGACTLVFSLFDALVLSPLPVPEPDSIVRLIKIRPRLPTESDFSLLEYETIRDHSTTLRSVAAAFQMNAGYTDKHGCALAYRPCLIRFSMCSQRARI